MDVLAALEASVLARAIRASVWLYPIANVLHVLGAMSFFAAVAAMDVKAMRTPVAADVRTFIRRVRPFAIAFFAVQAVSGVVLFLPEASHTGHNAAFLTKLGTNLLELVNVVALETALARLSPAGASSVGVGLTAAASLALWLAVAALGRLIAYF
jgi:hypothetical protein